ncbi:unnamed protein product [[Actinomadura] parvosata subsp. kistnae]|nr:unnamed protein product [Actinomadura parvosata subsp. kistnae]
MYLEGLPDDTPVVIDVRSGEEYVRVEDIRSSNDDHSTAHRPRVKLTVRRVKRDEIQQELNDLRAGLCYTLGKYHSEPGPQGLTVITVLSDQEIYAEIRRLRDLAEQKEKHSRES